jgi:ferredoxin
MLRGRGYLSIENIIRPDAVVLMQPKIPVGPADILNREYMKKGEPRLIAHVDKNLCSGCGACEAECPAGAIKVSDVAEVDANLCTGCGACVEVCPLEALSMK